MFVCFRGNHENSPGREHRGAVHFCEGLVSLPCFVQVIVFFNCACTNIRCFLDYDVKRRSHCRRVNNGRNVLRN